MLHYRPSAFTKMNYYVLNNFIFTTVNKYLVNLLNKLAPNNENDLLDGASEFISTKLNKFYLSYVVPISLLNEDDKE